MRIYWGLLRMYRGSLEDVRGFFCGYMGFLLRIYGISFADIWRLLCEYVLALDLQLVDCSLMLVGPFSLLYLAFSHTHHFSRTHARQGEKLIAAINRDKSLKLRVRWATASEYLNIAHPSILNSPRTATRTATRTAMRTATRTVIHSATQTATASEYLNVAHPSILDSPAVPLSPVRAPSASTHELLAHVGRDMSEVILMCVYNECISVYDVYEINTYICGHIFMYVRTDTCVYVYISTATHELLARVGRNMSESILMCVCNISDTYIIYIKTIYTYMNMCVCTCIYILGNPRTPGSRGQRYE